MKVVDGFVFDENGKNLGHKNRIRLVPGLFYPEAQSPTIAGKNRQVGEIVKNDVGWFNVVDPKSETFKRYMES